MRTFLVFAPLRSCTDRPGRMTFSPGFPSAHPGQLDRKAHHSPLHRHPATRPLPREELPRASAPGSHPRSLVPSSWFCTTSTASSASQSAGLLHPAAGPGVRSVSALASPTGGRGRSDFLTAQDSYPSKEPPNDSRTASPRPLPPCRSSSARPPARAAPLLGRPLRGGWARGVDFEALLHHRVPASDRAIAGADHPVLPGLRSPSRSFATAGDPSPAIDTDARPTRGLASESSVPHPPSPGDRSRRRERAALCGEPRSGGAEPEGRHLKTTVASPRGGAGA